MIGKETSFIRIFDIPVSDFDIFELLNPTLGGLFRGSIYGGVGQGVKSHPI